MLPLPEVGGGAGGRICVTIACYPGISAAKRPRRPLCPASNPPALVCMAKNRAQRRSHADRRCRRRSAHVLRTTGPPFAGLMAWGEPHDYEDDVAAELGRLGGGVRLLLVSDRPAAGTLRSVSEAETHRASCCRSSAPSTSATSGAIPPTTAGARGGTGVRSDTLQELSSEDLETLRQLGLRRSIACAPHRGRAGRTGPLRDEPIHYVTCRCCPRRARDGRRAAPDTDDVAARDPSGTSTPGAGADHG